MNLFLHTPNSNAELGKIYQSAFKNATELFLVTAYLTEWDTTLELNNKCRSFRIIIGKDFGITRKVACLKVMKWLPPGRKSQFMVADQISGFHPKAIFWKDINNKHHSLVGSSNLSRAAFDSNYEANAYSVISKEEYEQAKKWVKEIEALSLVVSEDWLSEYQEGQPSPRRPNTKKDSGSIALISLKLPKPKGSKKLVENRREQLIVHKKKKKALHKLFHDCATEKISSSSFYQKLPTIWSWEIGNRLQGLGWERQGKGSDFRELSTSFSRILDASNSDRDDVVVQEIDRLKLLKVPTRRALLTEMLCLAFPKDYPVLNKPVLSYLSDIKFKAPRGASEGSKYLDLAKKLRFSLLQNPNHPAKTLAELDTVIWLEYGEG